MFLTNEWEKKMSKVSYRLLRYPRTSLKGSRVVGEQRDTGLTPCMLSKEAHLLPTHLLMGDKMVLVENVREILRREKGITPLQLTQQLNIPLDLATDVLRAIRGF